MDNKKRQRNLNLILILLATASMGMFAYSNIYFPNFAEENKVTVYVATQEIPAHVDLEEGMFQAVKVSENSYIPGSITNLSEVLGKQLNGKLEKGELLFHSRIAEESENDGPLVAELAIPTSIPLKHNDTIRVYVQYVQNGKVVVDKLFDAKKVIAREKINGSSVGEKFENATNQVLAANGDSAVVYVRLTDEEVIEYQKAINTGTLYAVKIDGEEDEGSIVEGSQISEYQVKEKQDKNGNTIALYEVKEGDTIQSIAQRFTTTEERIMELNNGKTNFKPGDKIQVPGN